MNDDYNSALGGSSLLSNQPLVIDNGSGVCKAGFAGDESAKTVFPNFLGRPKHPRCMAGSTDGDYFIGESAVSLRGLLACRYPLEHGIVVDWQDMELIFHHIYSKLKVSSEEHPVLLTEAPLNPRRNREKAAEIFFESFNCPALFVSVQAILALYASGRTTGVVLDSGDGVTHVVPVFEGFALSHAIQRMDIAGRDVTESLILQLRRHGHVFHSSSEFEICREMKEHVCYVSFNPSREEAGQSDGFGGYGYNQTTGKGADGVDGKGGSAGNNTQTGGGNVPKSFKLPDGQIVQLGPERFRAPECLFQPSLIGLEYRGIHEQLHQAIAKSDLDLRKTLYTQIVLSGGSTMFPGFGDRLLNEVRKLVPKDCKIRISAPPTRDLSTWTGGSILASLATFKSMWVSREEYDEEGGSIMHKKTF